MENPKPDDIEVRQVCAGESEELMVFLLAHYYPEEPLTAGTSPPEPEAADKEFLLSNVPFGTCFMALQGGRIVAAVVAGPKDSHEPEHMAEEARRHAGGKWGRILHLLSAVESATDVCRRFGVPSSLHVHALGVDPVVRGRSLGARLMTAVAQRARELGHPLVSVDCTSVYSARLVQRLGYQLVNTLRVIIRTLPEP
ncbi:arylalkylamine N-acetyltransferase 1 isoform X2 [Drosophila rhopaloa]|uniref:aralkylamine N-acetyltransferase n=1 Tax=Drosophila rhopaloa TaxID=1041015 RepID=A0A6P4ESN4_DRORH|nr:arylalkylamine N-acetyltransferase 1 isoform X2 [Drosophila rhopaloa]